MHSDTKKWSFLAVVVFFLSCRPSQSASQITPLTSPQLWQRLEFTVGNVPPVGNPFDSDRIRLDATITFPSGRTLVVPAFWYQGFQLSLSGGNEQDVPVGTGGWRFRFTPPESGSYSLSLTIQTNGQPFGGPVITNFSVPPSPPPLRSGYVGIAPSRQYFQTGDGQPLRLVGENVAWGNGPGTFSYDTWFSHMQSAGENYARIWMCPWEFGIETTANSRTNYSLRAAWQLDQVLQLAEQRGIYVLLCLDFHGMFATQPDSWGGNNYWPQNPYNVTNGGPCKVANDFFTNSTARWLYQKRLRYLIARYGYSQNLLAWEFFNEIDNEYSFLNSANVAAWHGVMGGWMHTNDVFGHLVTTSLTGNSDRPEIWSLPQLDFAAYHSYSETAPAGRLNTVAQSFLQRYGKPVMVGEFGTSSDGWNRTNDPYLRGWRQGIWGGALGGSAGTAMSWWWENIDGENDYSIYASLGALLNRTGWGRGTWTNIAFQTSGSPPVTVGNPVPGGQPVNVMLPLDSQWGGLTSGRLAVPGPTAVGYSANALESFVHGIYHPDLKTPFVMNAWLTNNARLVMHLNSVSDGSRMVVKVDGNTLLNTNLPNLDGTYNVNAEYNLDIPVNLPAGLHSISVTNTGNDWFYLDWVRLEQVLPATYAGNWAPSAAAIGLQGPHESLLYVVAPGLSFPANATTALLPVQQGHSVILTNWPNGKFIAEWYDPATAASLGISRSTTINGSLTLLLPDYTEDLAAIVYPPPHIAEAGLSSTNGFRFRLDSETGGHYLIQRSFNLDSWLPFQDITNTAGTIFLADPSAGTNAQSFFRAFKVD